MTPRRVVFVGLAVLVVVAAAAFMYDALTPDYPTPGRETEDEVRLAAEDVGLFV